MRNATPFIIIILLFVGLFCSMSCTAQTCEEIQAIRQQLDLLEEKCCTQNNEVIFYSSGSFTFDRIKQLHPNFDLDLSDVVQVGVGNKYGNYRMSQIQTGLKITIGKHFGGNLKSLEVKVQFNQVTDNVSYLIYGTLKNNVNDQSVPMSIAKDGLRSNGSIYINKAFMNPTAHNFWNNSVRDFLTDNAGSISSITTFYLRELIELGQLSNADHYKLMRKIVTSRSSGSTFDLRGLNSNQKNELSLLAAGKWRSIVK